MPPTGEAECKMMCGRDADEDGFCSDACYHLYQEEVRRSTRD